MASHNIIVIGTSAGGVSALVNLVREFPVDFPAAIFIVLHLAPEGTSLLPEILNRSGALHASHPKDRTPIKVGHIYVAPPDHHMLVEKNCVRIVKGPRENRHRPAIDPLFRSAALAYGPAVIGVVLTGALDDGTAGLATIKRRGGLVVVQDPQDALYPSMPASAIAYVAVDYTVPLAQMSQLLLRLAHEVAPDESEYPISEELEKEVRIAKMDEHTLSEDKHVGTSSVFSCPECGGVLWELQDDTLMRYRCRVGHAFSIESVQAAQTSAVEDALWTALKTLEETVAMSRRLVKQASENGQIRAVKLFQERLHQAEQRATVIRNVLLSEQIEPLEEIVEIQ